MRNGNGCFSLFVITLSFWVWFILTFFETKLWIGILIYTLLAYICWNIFKAKQIIPNTKSILIFGVICGMFINLLIGVTIWIAIVSAIFMTIDFVQFLYIYYETR